MVLGSHRLRMDSMLKSSGGLLVGGNLARQAAGVAHCPTSGGAAFNVTWRRNASTSAHRRDVYGDGPIHERKDRSIPVSARSGLFHPRPRLTPRTKRRGAQRHE